MGWIHVATSLLNPFGGILNKYYDSRFIVALLLYKDDFVSILQFISV